jgi:hypothetical protein
MMPTARFEAFNAKSPIAGAILRSLHESGGTELSIPGLRSLSPLSDKAQVLVDQAVVEVGLERLQFAADLMAAGLVYNLPDPLSVTQLEWDQESKVGGAMRVMSPSARGESQLTDRKHNRLPIYLTMEGFSLDIRTLRMSERVGQPLDTSIIKQSTRRVNEAIEDAAINGATTADGQLLTVAGYQAPGLLNPPGTANSANTTTDWTLTGTIGTDGPARVVDVLAAISTLQAAKKFGPYNLYVGTKAGNAINADFKVNTMGTIRQRIEQIEAGGRAINVRVADRMPNTNTSGDVQFALVQMTDDVVQMVNGQPPTVIPWTSLDGFTLHWVIMAIMVQRVRSDYDGNSGIFLGKKT